MVVKILNVSLRKYFLNKFAEFASRKWKLTTLSNMLEFSLFLKLDKFRKMKNLLKNIDKLSMLSRLNINIYFVKWKMKD